MGTKRNSDEAAVISSVHYPPAVSIIQAFEPMMTPKKQLEQQLKVALHTVESRLRADYPEDKALAVIQKLKNTIQNLNYTTHKKSVAIFVSPLVEKVFYLEVPVEEKIIIDESFEIRDLVYSKKQNIQYLVMLLSETKSEMYLGNCSKFLLIKSNKNIEAVLDDSPERVANFSDMDRHNEILLDKFLRHMDEDLSIVLKAYNLPVFVLGSEKVSAHFRKITKHGEHLIKFIHGNYQEANEGEIRKVMQPYIRNWRDIKQQELLQHLEGAMSGHKLAVGIEEVWAKAMHKNSRLLVVEKDFIYPATHGSNPDIIYKADLNASNTLYIKDAVDDVIEKVIDNGGDIEFVENDVLKEYNRIALVQYY